MTLAEYFEKNLYNTRLKLSTVISMRSSLNFVKKYDIDLSKISIEWLNKFDAKLKSSGLAQSSVTKVHRHVKTMIRQADFAGLIPRNPYGQFRMEKINTTRKFLSEDEMYAIIGRGGYYSAIFEFQCLTGMHVSDLVDFSKDKVSFVSVDGSSFPVIRGERKKNGEPYLIPLSRRAEEIAKSKNYSFHMDVIEYNKWLKDAAQEVGIGFPVTSSVARHTYATLALGKGASLESISEALGHTSVGTTAIYAKVTGQKIIKDYVKNGLI